MVFCPRNVKTCFLSLQSHFFSKNLKKNFGTQRNDYEGNKRFSKFWPKQSWENKKSNVNNSLILQQINSTERHFRLIGRAGLGKNFFTLKISAYECSNFTLSPFQIRYLFICRTRHYALDCRIGAFSCRLRGLFLVHRIEKGIQILRKRGQTP